MSDSKKRVSTKLVVGVVAGVLVLGGGAALAASILRPSAIEIAGEVCAGSKPLDALFDEIRQSASPEASPEPSPEASPDGDDAFAKLFNAVISVEDDGSTLIINTKPKDDDPLGVTSLALDCVYEQLEVPTHISERIGATRSLDGRQDGRWDEYSASWSYHPDSGANVIIVHE